MSESSCDLEKETSTVYFGMFENAHGQGNTVLATTRAEAERRIGEKVETCAENSPDYDAFELGEWSDSRLREGWSRPEDYPTDWNIHVREMTVHTPKEEIEA